MNVFSALSRTNGYHRILNSNTDFMRIYFDLTKKIPNFTFEVTGVLCFGKYIESGEHTGYSDRLCDAFRTYLMNEKTTYGNLYS